MLLPIRDTLYVPLQRQLKSRSAVTDGNKNKLSFIVSKRNLATSHFLKFLVHFKLSRVIKFHIARVDICQRRDSVKYCNFVNSLNNKN